MNRRPSASWLALVVVLLLACSGTSYAVGRAQSGDTLISKGTLSGNRLRTNTLTGVQINESKLGRVPRAALADKVPAVPRRALPLDPAWASAPQANNSPYFGRDAQGWVHLEGAVTRTAVSGSVIATLPVGYRPTAYVYVIVYTSSSGAVTPGSLQIGPDGVITYYTGSNGLISLEGVDFRAAT